MVARDSHRSGRKAPDMIRTSRAGLLFGGLLAFAGTAASADDRTVHVPAYHPRIGHEVVYRLYLEANVDTHGAIDGAGGVLKGEMFDRLVVISASTEGFVMRWRIEPCRRDENGPTMCDHIREKLESYGFDGIVVQTNRIGALQKIEQLDDIKRNVDARLTGLTNPKDPLRPKVTALQQELAADPLSPASVIAPAARLFSDTQIDREQDYDLNAPQEREDTAQINGVAVPMKLTSVVTADFGARTATFSQTKSLDPAAYAKASDASIRQTLAQMQQKFPEVGESQLSQLARASLTVTSKVKISLDDGSTVAVEEVVDNKIGPLYLKNVMRATRE